MGMDHIRPENIEGAEPLWKKFLKDESSSGQGPPLADISNIVKAGVMATTMYANSPAEAAPLRVHVGSSVEQQKTEETFSEGDARLLATNAFHEAKGESAEGQLATAQVVLARMASGKFGSTVRLVIYSPNQFSWTKEIQKPLAPEVQTRIEEWGGQLSTFLKGKTPAKAVKELSAITRVPQNALYYKRTDWNEHDPKEQRMSTETKAMFRALVKVAVVGQHTFYAEPARVAKKN